MALMYDSAKALQCFFHLRVEWAPALGVLGERGVATPLAGLPEWLLDTFLPTVSILMSLK